MLVSNRHLLVASVSSWDATSPQKTFNIADAPWKIHGWNLKDLSIEMENHLNHPPPWLFFVPSAVKKSKKCSPEGWTKTGSFIFLEKLPSGKLTWLAGISPCSIGNASSMGPFSIVMLVYRSVTDFSIWGSCQTLGVLISQMKCNHILKNHPPQKISRQQYINKCGNSGGKQIFAFPINISEIHVYQVIQKWPFWDS